MKQSKLILLIILWTCIKLHAQQSRFINISNELNIPSPVCYNVVRDHQGYIWICTDAGLCRYDGTALKTFDGKNGLPEASIYEVAEDLNHNMWFATSKNRILTYANDSLVELPVSKKYTKFANEEFSIPFKIDFVSEDIAYINSRQGTYKIDHKKNTIENITEYSPLEFNYLKLEHNIVPIKNARRKEPKNPYIIQIKFENKKQIQISLPPNLLMTPHWRVETLCLPDRFFIATDQYLVQIRNDYSYSITSFPNRILAIFKDKNNGLWVGMNKSGLFYYPNIDDLENPVICLTENSISGIAQDFEGGIWCSSLEKGLFYCYNTATIDYTNVPGLDKYMDLLTDENGQILASSNGDKLFEIKDKVIAHELNLKLENNISDIKKTSSGWIFSSIPALFTTDANFKNHKLIRNRKNGVPYIGYETAMDPDNNTYAIAYSGIIKIEGSEGQFTDFTKLVPSKRILFKDKNEFYIGTDLGLYYIDIRTSILKKITGKSQVTKIKKGKHGVWVSSKGDGLYLIKDSIIYHVSKALKIPTDYFYDCTEDQYHNIWASSNIGVVKLFEKDGQYHYDVYDILDGIPSNNVYKIAANNENVFIATTEGVNSFPIHANLNNNIPPKLYLNNIYVNNNKYDCDSNTLQLKYNQNSLRIVFDVLSYRNFNHKKLFYILKGKETKTQEVTGNEIILDNLEPDKYEIEIFALNDDGLRSTDSIILNIEIEYPFWEKTWFIVISVIIFCLILYYSIKMVIDKIKTNEAAKTQINKMMAEYQLTAIQAQMNPHFIFNAINSIQSYILQKNESQAYDYLAKFSKLIRIVLNNSEQKILALQQELDMLDLYIQLEQLRFDNSFEFILHITDDVNTHETYIPAMIIQPYVENAIWHGLMNLESRKGILKINVSIYDDNLLIIVEDNGVGRELAATFKKDSEHKSVSMKLNEKRLKMINQLKDFEDAKVLVIDICDKNGIASGTRVEIYIPID